ncbi:biotin transporter BioY [Methanobacterium sp. SMA-27]|uniref:biotin transporter BioY n=1 Tax=Methanobacterium sp. SMA-27 TaxID=1495336 RepID=UPI00064E9620|nr:biotin transporter BioY [Methanobacterium sp. SMA-27]
MEITIDNYFEKRHSLFKWRTETSNANKLVMAFFMACITGLMAQIIIPLPWTPVPITAQTFAVLIAGILLGRYWGGLSMVIYLLIGFVGVPWFTGMTGGIGVITGATGGFLIGFILTALFLGYFSDNYINARGFKSMLVLLLVSNFAFIYIPGLIGLGAWLYVVNGTIPGIWTLLVMGLLPFLIGDLIKIGGAAALAKAVTPKESFNDGDNLIDNGNWRIF